MRNPRAVVAAVRFPSAGPAFTLAADLIVAFNVLLGDKRRHTAHRERRAFCDVVLISRRE